MDIMAFCRTCSSRSMTILNAERSKSTNEVLLQPQYGTLPVIPEIVFVIVCPMSSPALDRWPLNCYNVSKLPLAIHERRRLTSCPTPRCSSTSQST